MKKWIALFAVSLFAQDVTFKSETKLVIVDLTAKDKNGHAITTLTKDDVAIFEDGVRQKISVFELQKLSGQPLTPLSFVANNAPRTIEERAPSNSRAKPKPSVVAPAANSVVRYQDRRLLCLFFDMTSMDVPEQVRAEDAAVKFLAAQMTSSDLVEIMTYTTSIKVVQEWTDDRDELVSAIHKLNLGEGADLADMATTTADENDDSGSFTADDTEFNIFNTDRKLSAIEDAARKLSIFPEKKALIYFSSGIGKTGVENQSQIKATTNAANRANVSIYPVDARGLVALPPGGDASQASPRGTGLLSQSKQNGIRSSFNDTQETLVTIAEDTGGHAMLDTNDLTMGMRRAQEDMNSYYILGYYSTNSKNDGKFRRIDVKLVNKEMSARLDFRKGYYADKTWQKFTANDKERQLEEALTLGDPVNELPLAVEVDYFRVARERYFVPIAVKIPGSAVGLTRHGARQTNDLDFIGQIRDASGRLVSGVRDEITVKLDEANASKIGQRNLEYDTGLALGPGAYTLRFLARENLTGKMGTFETKFTIPDLNNSKTLRLSSVIWSNQKEPITAAVGDAGTNKKLIAQSPLVENNQKIVPSITRVFRKDQTLYVYFEVYDPAMDPERRLPSLMADIDLLLNGRKVYTSPPARVNKMATTRPGVAPFAFQIALQKLPPGRYISQVNVIDETGRKFAFPRSEIVLLGPENTAPPQR